MRVNALTLAVAVVCAVPVMAQAQEKTHTLPLKKVRLYETGVGYFERIGRLQSGGNEVTLPVPAGHLDDALKTLVVLSKDGKANVTGVEFGSSVSRQMARALAGLPGESDEPLSYQNLLTTLKGAPVEIAVGNAKTKGRLIDVLDPERDVTEVCEVVEQPGGTKNCVQKKTKTLLLLTEEGAILRFAGDQVTAIRALDPAFKSRLGSSLDALGEHGTQSRRQLRVLAGKASSVTLGYVAETPVWRSTYRLVLDQDGGAMQAWALLHNDTDEDWHQVNVELVNGRPDSFLFPLAAPRYARRELVTPERELSTVPQLHDQTVDNMWEGAGGLGLTGIGSGGGGSGYGIGLGSIGTIGHGGGVGSGSGQSALLSVGNLAGVAQAEGTESGALFHYALANAVDLRAHGSALLPFAQFPVSIERIAYFESPGASARSAVHLRHTGRQTLPAGPIAVFETGGFAGESALSRTKPGESRIISFGFDMDIEFEQERTRVTETPRVLLYDNGLVEHYIRKHEVRFKLTNRSGSARKLYLRLGYVNNASVAGADGLEYDVEHGHALAAFDSAPGKQVFRDVVVEEGLTRNHAIGDAFGATQARALAASTTLPPAQRAALRSAAAHYEQAHAHDVTRAQRERDLAALAEDIGRLQNHVRALGESRADEADELVKRLLAAEDRTRRLRGQIEKLSQEAKRQRERAVKAIEGLELPASK